VEGLLTFFWIISVTSNSHKPVSAWFLLLALVVILHSQSAAIARDARIESVDIPLISWISDRERAGRGTLDQFNINPKRDAAFRDLIRVVANENDPRALFMAARAGFKLTDFRPDQPHIIAITDTRHPDQGPIVLINRAPQIDLIAGAPHPSNEKGTYQQAVLLVTEKGARAAIIAGAHRCASRTYVTCDGRTRTCGSREAYRTSDVAHSPATLFHAAHVALLEAWPQAVVLSLHGMRTDRKGVRTSLVLSNGVRGPDPDGTTAASRLRYAMMTALPGEGAVVSCNLPGDRQYEFLRLCGTTNIQGRLVNGDNDVCHRGVTSGTGRFIHLEQDRTVRNPFAENWRGAGTDEFIQKYLNAIVSVARVIK
jgi:hypothetical protein